MINDNRVKYAENLFYDVSETVDKFILQKTNDKKIDTDEGLFIMFASAYANFHRTLEILLQTKQEEFTSMMASKLLNKTFNDLNIKLSVINLKER